MFSAYRKEISKSNRFSRFRKWLCGMMAIDELSVASGYIERQLRRWFSEYLEHVPEWIVGIHKGTHLLIDGTWLPDGRCVIVYRDQDRRSTLYYNICDGENEYEIAADLVMLRGIGITVSSFTTDGSEEIIRAIRYTHPHV